MPTTASPKSMSMFARVQRWLGLDDADDASECPCAVAARIERAAAEARAKRLAAKDMSLMRKAAGVEAEHEPQPAAVCSIAKNAKRVA